MSGFRRIRANPASHPNSALIVITLIGTSPAFTNEKRLEKKQELESKSSNKSIQTGGCLGKAI